MSFFGTMCLFSKVNSLCTVKTLTHVKILCITEETFWRSASIYPTVFTQFKIASNTFDILTEFKKIPIHPTLDNTEIEKNSLVPPGKCTTKWFKCLLTATGSFINVISYCKRLDENYSAPFRD